MLFKMRLMCDTAPYEKTLFISQKSEPPCLHGVERIPPIAPRAR